METTPRPQGHSDPSGASQPGSGIFGLGNGPDDAGVHIIAAPFDATTSFRRGAAEAPAAILAASHQVDLFDMMTGHPYQAGIWMAPIDDEVHAWSLEARRAGRADRKRANEICARLNDRIHGLVGSSLGQDKLVGLVGGDHATAFGAILAHAERYPGMGLVHIDAHADLRPAYDGYTHSHASILHNVLEQVPHLGRVVQIGLRDLCQEEYDRISHSPEQLKALFDHEWARARMVGADLGNLVRRTIERLPAEVYITFDIDGLDPGLCPNTGTPVPGGLQWTEAMLILDELVRSGRTIVGFDLTEVAPAPAPLPAGESDNAAGHPPGSGLDEIIGARLLYRLIGFSLLSRGGQGAGPEHAP